jgi:hypothetical protein
MVFKLNFVCATFFLLDHHRDRRLFCPTESSNFRRKRCILVLQFDSTSFVVWAVRGGLCTAATSWM